MKGDRSQSELHAHWEMLDHQSRSIVESMRSQLSHEDLESISEFITHNEFGCAAELMAHIMINDPEQFPSPVRAQLENLLHSMGLEFPTESDINRDTP
jgi:hypothetical protein